MPILWFTNVFIYFGIGLGLGLLNGDIYINGICSGIAEISGYLIGGYLAQCKGRKFTLKMMYSITGVALLIYSFISNKDFDYFLVFLGKFGVSGTSYLVILLTA